MFENYFLFLRLDYHRKKLHSWLFSVVQRIALHHLTVKCIDAPKALKFVVDENRVQRVKKKMPGTL